MCTIECRPPKVWAAGEGSYAEAAAAYEAAGDLDSVVRLNLEELKNPHKAAAIVRKAGSRDAAQRLAQHCLAARDYQVLHNAIMNTRLLHMVLLLGAPSKQYNCCQNH